MNVLGNSPRRTQNSMLGIAACVRFARWIFDGVSAVMAIQLDRAHLVAFKSEQTGGRVGLAVRRERNLQKDGVAQL